MSADPVMPNEFTRETFIARLVRNGWSRDDAAAEWDSIQNDEDESGYDGP